VSRPKNFSLLSSDDLKNVESEADFQARVVTLARMSGWQVFAIPDSRRATMAGYPDLTMFRAMDRRIIFAELKREKGRLSLAQDEVLGQLKEIARNGGCEVYVWRPSDWPDIVKSLEYQRNKKI
jgi:hypothetical protein